MIDRERKVDVSTMSQEQVDQLSLQIGDKVRQMCDETATRINTLLNIYGMHAKIAISFDTLPKEFESMMDKPKKTRKKAQKKQS